MMTRIAHIAAAIAALLLAAPAWSAEVTKVRVGQHPDFTRVVFELDSPAGYRVSRANNPDGSVDIVVTLDASAEARSIRSGSSLVKGVTVDTGTGRSMARIHLRSAGLPLKEMILREPARIVLDVMGTDEALLKLQAARKARAAERAKKRQAAAKPAPKPVAKAPAPKPPAPKPVAKAPAPKPKKPPTPPAPAPVVAKAKPQPAPPKPAPPVARTEPKPAPKPPAPKVAEKAPERELSAEEAARAAMRERLARVEKAKQERMREAEEAREARQQKLVAEAPARPEPKPEAEEPRRGAEREAPAEEPEEGSSLFSFDPMMAAAIAGGIVLILVLVMVMRRRRSLPKNLDVTALAESEPGGDERIPAGGFSMDLDDSDLPADAGDDVVVGVTDRDQPPLSAPGLFDEAEKGDTAMDQQGIDLGDTMSSATTQTGMGAGPDAGGMMAEFERRIAQLESRLDQEVEARERLERQVAAQSEELRVQRAAIARTQRALRGMTRSEEEQATEPALRDPSS